MCNEIKCAIQSTVDLININITRDVQEECANRLYRVCTHSSNADDGEIPYRDDDSRAVSSERSNE